MLFGRLFASGVEFNDFRLFVKAPFVICSSLGRHSTLSNCVSAQRERHLQKCGTFVCNASEMLLLRPVLLHFLQRVVQVNFDIKNELASFEALSDLCLAAFRVKLHRVGQAHYMACVAQYCRLTKIVYGEGCTKPKHHFALH